MAALASSLVIRVPGDGGPTPGNDTIAAINGTATDSQSNFYISGSSANSLQGALVDLDPHHAYGDNRDLIAAGAGFLAKYDADGFLQWSYVSSVNWPKKVEVGQLTDDLYVGMWNDGVHSIAKFDAASGGLLWQSPVESIGKFTIDEQTSSATRIYQTSSQYVSPYSYAKINAYTVTASGLTPLWSASQIFTSGGSTGAGSGAGDVAVSTDHGSIYVGGGFKGNVDFDPSPSKTFRLSTGSTDTSTQSAGYVWKLDAATGAFRWAKAFTVGKAASFSNVAAVEVDPSGDVIVAGGFLGTVDLDPGKGTLKPTSAGSTDVFVVKLDQAGNLKYARTYGTSTGDAFLGMVSDSAGDIYLSYSYTGPAGEVAPRRVQIQKISNAGASLWTYSYGFKSGGQYGADRQLLVDAMGRVHVTGSFNSELYIGDFTVPTYTSDEQSMFWFTLTQ